jgi:hypothetical protein
MVDFSEIKPWQIVNRIPGINSLCRKAPFTVLLQRVMSLSPNDVTFLPKSFVLPRQNNELYVYFTKRGKSIIIKPDNGSLGCGISIIQPGNKLPRTSNLAVAQELIEPFLLNSIKFDFRVYALIASISPLSIFVYRDGVARFCADLYSKNSKFSCITNTYVNKQKAAYDTITKMVSEVMSTLQGMGVNTELIWKKIDKIINVTVLSGIGLMEDASKCLANPGRCFQILGFDILIDSRQEPKILEVNYRPSLECGNFAERIMKREMLSKAMMIVMKGWYSQDEVSSHMTDEARMTNLSSPPTRNFQTMTGFDQSFPPSDKFLYQRYLRIISEVKKLPSILSKNEKIPIDIQVCPISFHHQHSIRESLPSLESSPIQKSKSVERQIVENKLDAGLKSTDIEERKTITSLKVIRSSTVTTHAENTTEQIPPLQKLPSISRPFTSMNPNQSVIQKSPSQSQFSRYLQMMGK